MIRFLSLAAVLLLSACSWFGGTSTDDTGDAASSASSESSVRETQNVSYQGVIEALGPGVFMQGTHQLRLSDGRVVLLESRDIDLNRYLNKRAGVFGATRPTVEGGGIIMRVEEVIVLEEESSSVQGSERSSVTGEASSEALASATPASSAAAVQNTPAVVVPAGTSSSMMSVPSAPSQNDPVPPAMSARAGAMAKDKMDPTNWTQRYCTSHIGFCVPVHRNWWFKSFGTTTSSLWHVEVSNAEIQNLGEGVIIIRLLSGNVASRKATDGQVRIQGNWAMGFKEWGQNEHFEIMAPANLRAAVEYMTGRLTAEQ